MDWAAWHAGYDQPGSHLDRRLELVRARVREALNHAPAGTIRAISMCAGQGRDLLGVLAEHPRRADVRARLVELDPANAEYARRIALQHRLDAVEVITGDASSTNAYAGIVPAELVMACGIFGNVSEADIERTVRELPRLTTAGGTVLWTRHRKQPDMTTNIRRWFAECGFEEIWFDLEGSYGVGAHRFAGTPEPFVPDRTLFTFLSAEHFSAPDRTQADEG